MKLHSYHIYILVIAILILSNCSVISWAQGLEKCQDFNNKMRIEDCTALIKGYLSKDINDRDPINLARAYYSRANAFHIRKSYKKSILDYNQALDYSPNFPNAYADRSDAYFSLNKNKRSIVDISIAISLLPKNAGYYAQRGYFYSKSNQFKSAIYDFTKSIDLGHPEAAEMYNYRGYAYLWLEDYVNAIKDIKQAIALKPDDLNFQHSLGEAQYYSGDIEKAELTWEVACVKAIDPEKTKIDWHAPLAKMGYYKANIETSCNNQTIEAFKRCAKEKCRF